METFKPIYVYIKQHSVTGLKYFGKTSRKDPFSYLGSGKYWLRHIKKYGVKNVVTLWIQRFTDRESLIKYALTFSELNNVADSIEWTNLIPENGLDGLCIGFKHSIETKDKMRTTNKGNSYANGNQNRKGKKWADESKKKISLAFSGKGRFIQQFDLKGILIKESTLNVFLSEGFYSSGISSVINGKWKHHKGFIFKLAA